MVACPGLQPVRHGCYRVITGTAMRAVSPTPTLTSPSAASAAASPLPEKLPEGNVTRQRQRPALARVALS